MRIKLFQTYDLTDYNGIPYSSSYLLDEDNGVLTADSSMYKLVFDGENPQENLEEIFTRFNISHPENYTGRSMSYTDIIYLAAENKYYFCDTLGFKEVIFDENQVKESKIKVVYLEPDKLARIIELDNDLSSLQKAVGGYIQTFYGIDYPCCIVCNDEAKINGMALNRAVRQNGKIIDIIAGPFFICDCSTPNFKSLTPQQLDQYMKTFKFPELFFKAGKEILGVPYNPDKAR